MRGMMETFTPVALNLPNRAEHASSGRCHGSRRENKRLPPARLAGQKTFTGQFHARIVPTFLFCLFSDTYEAGSGERLPNCKKYRQFLANFGDFGEKL
jgi:hypothetical protein